MPTLVGPRKVRYSKEEVQEFNRSYPCSGLSDTRAYWFEFEANGDLVDHDVPEHSDGPGALALSQEAQSWLTSEGNYCQWFLLCENEAVGSAAHPILDAVPICKRCADKFSLTII